MGEDLACNNGNFIFFRLDKETLLHYEVWVKTNGQWEEE